MSYGARNTTNSTRCAIALQPLHVGRGIHIGRIIFAEIGRAVNPSLIGTDAVHDLSLMTYHLHHSRLKNTYTDNAALVLQLLIWTGESRLPLTKTPPTPFRA